MFPSKNLPHKSTVHVNSFPLIFSDRGLFNLMSKTLFPILISLTDSTSCFKKELKQSCIVNVDLLVVFASNQAYKCF